MWDTLEKHPFIQRTKETFLTEKSLLIEGLWDSPKALLIFLAGRARTCNVLVITGGERESRLFEDLSYFSDLPVYMLPAWETLPGEEIAPSPDIVGKRLRILHELQQQSGVILLASLQAVLQKVPGKTGLGHRIFDWRKGDCIPFDLLAGELTAMGYRQESLAVDKGQFAIRGGIADIFSVNSPAPYRIDFFDDEIEEIRIYDPISQKSVEKTERAFILPADEAGIIRREKDVATLLDYLGKGTTVVFDDLVAIEDKWISIKSLPGICSDLFLSFPEFAEQIAPLRKMYFVRQAIETLSSQVRHTTKTRYEETVSFEALALSLRATRIHHPFLSLEHSYFEGVPECDRLTSLMTQADEVHFLTESQAEKRALQEKLASLPALTPPVFHEGYLSSGFILGKVTVTPYSVLTNRHRIRRESQRTAYHTPVSDFYKLEPGDLVVHFQNGIGRFTGIETQKNHLGTEEEFMVIVYAEESKLYVPLSQSHLVSRYIGTDEKIPGLHTLGTKKWHNAKVRAEKSVVGYARELLKIQAKRSAKGGITYPPDSEDMRFFEEEFPFIETDDQLRAIAAIKEDMCSSKAMDRLVCGDVGYGKTEIAMRAAFKAVVDGGKQVAILVPTTVLAMQHYETFTERMIDFPIRLAVASRFLTTKKIKEILAWVRTGEIDILIGTHRIIGKDVEFKNLGLVIIDEEQRFGVRAKEHLKTIKEGVDCLTLSATPIPRTLYFSLVGAKDMSVINTPPCDRLPIKTVVAEREQDVITNALLRELARDGQVYFIHNRIDSIYRTAEELQKAVPRARIAVAHGRMNTDALDIVFHKFKQGETDVLIATTIVENGIDIPNANTILIDRADAYGMAELYQLRGRVGRWNRPAYAYFLIPKSRELREIARQKLQALVETSGFGGGVKLAMRDLEIRGAGDLLGTQQSGQVATVGFHFYCRLLKRAIEAMQRDSRPTFYDTRVEFPYKALFPATYIPETDLRIELYHRLGETGSEREVDLFFDEVKDRFGMLPEETVWLYHLSRVRIFAARHGFTLLRFGKGKLVVEKTDGEKTVRSETMLPPLQTPIELEKRIIPLLKAGFAIQEERTPCTNRLSV